MQIDEFAFLSGLVMFNIMNTLEKQSREKTGESSCRDHKPCSVAHRIRLFGGSCPAGVP